MQKQSKNSIDFWNYSGGSESEAHDKSDFFLFEVELSPVSDYAHELFKMWPQTKN